MNENRLQVGTVRSQPRLLVGAQWGHLVQLDLDVTTAELTRQLKAEALRLGFDRVGIAPAVSPPGYGRFPDWLQAGHAAGMDYMEQHAEARRHPDRLLEGVRSVVMVSLVYGERQAESSSPTQGKIARYARGQDYHRVLWDRLEELLGWLRQQSPEVRGRAVVDTAPLLERDFARLAGLGWIGKNTMLIDRKLGSFTFLGALLVDCELVPDDPHHADHCGTCTRCLDACPTDAFAGPYQLDARRCISYWTIEHKGPDSRGVRRTASRLGLRLRHLPGCLSLEPQGSPARAAAGVRRPGPSGPIPT